MLRLFVITALFWLGSLVPAHAAWSGSVSDGILHLQRSIEDTSTLTSLKFTVRHTPNTLGHTQALNYTQYPNVIHNAFVDSRVRSYEFNVESGEIMVEVVESPGGVSLLHLHSPIPVESEPMPDVFNVAVRSWSAEETVTVSESPIDVEYQDFMRLASMLTAGGVFGLLGYRLARG